MAEAPSEALGLGPASGASELILGSYTTRARGRMHWCGRLFLRGRGRGGCLDQMVPTGASQCVFWGSGGGEKIILSLSRSLLKCAWSFKGSPTVSKWNMFVNKQLLLTQLWVVRGVCFFLCCWSLLTISSRVDTSKQVDVCGGGGRRGIKREKSSVTRWIIL